ncbi:hypothetical protein [Mucisphaera calidilacus]|uniref:GAF domain-containing protein n=1 Tax=Mucisphaera calidilacus TaxID=2527982 RepID=A0A518BTI4_9BACT|nr:hypothetical protein [Mucisphaera calidilacus]QDU70283.1 hypothetical protein Pan265_01060 [Mucisphaera calidilacus]
MKAMIQNRVAGREEGAWNPYIGVRILLAFRSTWLSRYTPAIRVFLYGLTLFSGIWLGISLSTSSVTASTVVAICLVLQHYLDEVAKAHDATSFRNQIDLLAQFHQDAGGNLAQIANVFAKRHRNGSNPRLGKDAYQTELRNLQQHFLSHVTTVLDSAITAPAETRPSLTANWCKRGRGEHAEFFKVFVYDRHMTHRVVSDENWKPIAEDVPGASRSFLYNVVSLVEDTRSPSVAMYFDNPSYAGILSIPVSCNGSVLGVVNIDSTQANLLETDHDKVIIDVAYMVGLCELLAQEQ